MFYGFSNAQQFKDQSGYEINGSWYPRVTKIVDIKSKPGLYKFYAEMNNFIASENVKNQSAKEGTGIHAAIEAILLGERSEAAIYKDVEKDIAPLIRPAVTT